ncbi:universal stress protein [Pedobacter sp. G11]|uniref:universal stress protein n=1 Tax=Pedobacter sp. G11 TaxID=2482728 RepID=UPI000F5DDB0D|nr:universal stress protein [Pedobacter sp. G11]AZI26738.1 universal stress protein [Pedobacter sp. G11]
MTTVSSGNNPAHGFCNFFSSIIGTADFPHLLQNLVLSDLSIQNRIVVMYKILIATDFSRAAASAADYALRIACSCGMNLSIVHIYSVGLPMVAEETTVSQDSLYDLAENDSLRRLSSLEAKLNQDAEQLCNDGFKPLIEVFSTIGVPAAGIISFFNQKDMSIIVMGIKPEERYLGTLPGSTIRKLIKWTSVPVLLVPMSFPPVPIRQIVFATDLGDSEITALDFLAQIASAYHSDLLIFHNRKSAEEGRRFLRKEKRFLDKVAQAIDYPKVFYRHKQKDTIEEALAVLEKDSAADMLAMVHKKHSLIGELLGGDKTLKMISRTRVPLIIFPQGFTTSPGPASLGERQLHN